MTTLQLHAGAGTGFAQVVVAPNGVWAIDTRRGPDESTGGLLHRRTELFDVSPRTTTRWVARVAARAEALRAELDPSVPVGAMLCVLDRQWPLFGGAFEVDGVRVLWPSRAMAILSERGPLDTAAIADQLRGAFPTVTQHRPRTHRSVR